MPVGRRGAGQKTLRTQSQASRGTSTFRAAAGAGCYGTPVTRGHAIPKRAFRELGAAEAFGVADAAKAPLRE